MAKCNQVIFATDEDQDHAQTWLSHLGDNRRLPHLGSRGTTKALFAVDIEAHVPKSDLVHDLLG